MEALGIFGQIGGIAVATTSWRELVRVLVTDTLSFTAIIAKLSPNCSKLRHMKKSFEYVLHQIIQINWYYFTNNFTWSQFVSSLAFTWLEIQLKSLHMECIAKLTFNFNFNFNLVESWDNLIPSFSSQPPHPPVKVYLDNLTKLKLNFSMILKT